MLDHALERAFCAALQAAPELSDLHFFIGQTDEVHELPAITVTSKSESLAGSSTVFRSETEIALECHAHDAPSGTHTVILGYLQKVLADKSLLLAYANTVGDVYIFGYSFSTSQPEAIDGKFRTVLLLKAGYKVLTH